MVNLLIQAQPRLLSYALALLPNLDSAYDVLQETNRILLERADAYDADRDFVSWACGIIRHQVLAKYRDASRSKLIFDPELVEKISSLTEKAIGSDMRQAALSTCYAGLTDHQRMLVDMRYGPDGSVRKMAEELMRPAASISTSLHKIRQILEQCIRRTIQETGGGLE
jgi:RNA polymerase sigma-70 factor (ECF subfamily)